MLRLPQALLDIQRFFRQGVGDPEGAIVAPVGAWYSRRDGSTGTSFYRKETGTDASGWVTASLGEVPAGGTTDQLLTKTSDADYDLGWADPGDPAGAAAAAQAASQPLDADLTAIAALTTTAYGRSLLTLAPQTSGALPTVTLSSGTAAQVSTARDVEVHTPVTFNPLIATVATCKVELSPDNSTFSTLAIWTVPVGVAFAGTVQDVTVRVPKSWYVRLTAAQAVLGTSTYY